MARTPAQRGPFGRWLTRVRTERYERQVDALEAMKRLAGLHISQAEYSQWESGSRVPREDNPKVARLYEFFGSRPDEETGPAQVGEAGLQAIVEAIDRQTAAITAAISARDSTLAGLLSELGQYRRSQLDVLRALQEPARVEPMPGDEPERAPHGAPATPAVRRSVD